MRRLLNIKLIALLLLSTLSIAPSFAAPTSNVGNALPAKLAGKFQALDFVSGDLPKLDLYMYQRDEVINLAKASRVRLGIGTKSLYKSKEPWANFTVDMYEVLPGGQRLFVSSQSIARERKGSKFALFNMDLNRFDTNYKNVEFDVFDTNHKLINTYSTQLSAINIDTQGQSVEEPVPPADCDGSKFDDCQLDYIFSRLTFEARPQKQITTRVIKGEDGNYTITFPVSRGVFNPLNTVIPRRGGGVGSDNSIVSDGTIFISSNGTALHFDETKNQLEFMFAGHNGASAVMTDDGRLGLGGVTDPNAFLEIGASDGTYAPIKLNAAELMLKSPNGAIEYDGQKLFITVNGIRQALAFNSEVEANRNITVFTGDVEDDQLPSTMSDKTINNLTVNGTFSFLGGSPSAGKFLTTDNNGNASWGTIPSVGGITALDVFAHTLNGYAINGAQASVAALSTTTTFLNGLAILERNAQIDRASITSLDSELDSVITGLAAGTVEVSMSGEITGENNGTVINGIAMYAKELRDGHSAGTFTPGAGTITNGDTLLSALQKIVGNVNSNTTNIATNTANIATNTADIADIQDDIANGGLVISANGDVTGSSNGLSLNGLALFAKQLKIGHSAGTFSAGAGTVTNGDSILSAFQKIVGNVNANTASISALDSDVDALLNGTNGFTMAGEITGQTDAAVINGAAMYAKELNLAATNGAFTPGAGTVTNGDTLVSALQKIVGNTNTNTSNIATNTSDIASHTSTLSSHTSTLSTHTTSINSHTTSISNLLNGDQAIPISGDLVGYTNGVTLNGFALFEKELKDGNGLALFTPGPGNQTLSNGDTLIEAIEKLAGNIDRTESDIVTTATQIAAHSATLASHTSSITTLTRDVSDLENGDSVIPLFGEIDGDSGSTSINGVSLFSKQLKVGVSGGLFTPAAGTVTNGDSILGAFQKIVGNVNSNTSTLSSHATTISSLSTTVSSHTTTLSSHTSSIATLSANVSDIGNGDTAIPIAGEITGTTTASTINGVALFAKELNSARSSGVFTPGAGNQTVSNGDTVIQALEKIAGNIDLNETNIAANTADIIQHTADISDLRNGGISLVFAGEITGYINGAVINGLSMYSKELALGNGSGLFTPGAGAETITNADTLHSALQKIAGNIDATESSISSHTSTLSTHTSNIAANAQNITDLANGDDAFSLITMAQSGNADVLLANNGGYLEVNGLRIITMNQIPGIDPSEAINISNGSAVAASVDYSDVDGNGTAAVAIKLTSDKIGGQTITLNLDTVGPDLVPTSYVINGVETNFGTIPDSLGDAFTVPGQDYKVYVSGNKVRILNVDPLAGLHGTSSYTKKTIRATYRAFGGS